MTKQKMPTFSLRGYTFEVTVTVPDGVESGMANMNMNVHSPDDTPQPLMRSVGSFLVSMVNANMLADFFGASQSGKDKLFATYESHTGRVAEEEGPPPPVKCERCGGPTYQQPCDACLRKEIEEADRLASIPAFCARCETKHLPIELVDSKRVGAAICLSCLRETEPSAKTWQRAPLTEKQRALLIDKGLKPEFVAGLTKGEASRYIGQIIEEGR